MALRRESPFGSGVKRRGSSPPSPVFDLPPIRFIAIASVVWASRLIDPNDIAPVENRLTEKEEDLAWLTDIQKVTGDTLSGPLRQAAEVALDRAAEGYRKVVEEHGRHAVYAIASGRAPIEAAYTVQKFMRAGLGNNQVDNCSRA